MYLTGSGSTIFDILEGADKLLVEYMDWERVSFRQRDTLDPVTGQNVKRLEHAIWMGSGDGTDKIYIQMTVPPDVINFCRLDGPAGFDPALYDFEQPGGMQQWLKSEGDAEVGSPAFSISPDERFYFWAFADTYHLVMVIRMGIQYESLHLGLLNPIASERQYPYSMYVCGNCTCTGSKWPNTTSASIVFPYGGTGVLRWADGSWRTFQNQVLTPSPTTEANLFPYTAQNQKLIPNFKDNDAISQDNFLLLPILLQITNPVNTCGMIRDAFWISGTRDIAAEQFLVFDGEDYIVFDTKEYRGANTYFAIKTGLLAEPDQNSNP